MQVLVPGMMPLQEGELASLTCMVCVFPLLVTPYANTVPADKQSNS